MEKPMVSPFKNYLCNGLKLKSKIRMKSLVYVGITCLLSAFAHAQQGKVTIQQDKKIADLMEIFKEVNSNEEYYRIQVGFGTLSKAETIKMQVDIDFPELPSKIDFDSPTYRVRIGQFKNKLDAERKFLEVREKYPDALLLAPKKSTR